jgi:DNA (cytosine-5)-methyltransferase 1
MPRPTIVSLFSGCGGSDIGLQEAGFEVVFSNDISKAACALYRENLPNNYMREVDVADIRTFPSADVLVGCYPCQGYSQGGKRDTRLAVNYLYREFDRALRIVSPKAFIVENVNGMAYGLNKTLLYNQLTRFRLAGYRVKWQVLDAKDYGLAQTRRRIFIVGIKSNLRVEYAFPEPTHGPARAQPYVTQREVLEGLPEWPEGQFCEEPMHWYYLSRRRRHDWEEPSPCVVGHWRHVPIHPMSPPLVRIDTDHWRFAHRGRARRLALREVGRLQGFQDTYRFDLVKVKKAFQAVGNAVPPPLMRAVAQAMPEVW